MLRQDEAQISAILALSHDGKAGRCSNALGRLPAGAQHEFFLSYAGDFFDEKGKYQMRKLILIAVAATGFAALPAHAQTPEPTGTDAPAPAPAPKQ